ncbi:MAG: phosphomannomutase/phosphoglucomutase [archaeon]
MNPEIFREYDIRGIADKEIPDEDAELVGKAFGTIIHNNGGSEIVVGKDNRKSGPRITKALLKGIASTGISVIFVGEVSTPEFYYAVHTLNADGGISVTASHNPPQYNGFKAMVGKKAIYGEEIKNIYNVAQKRKFANGKGKISEKNIDEEYIGAIASRVKVKRKVKLVIDAGNGMASELAPALLKKLGCEVSCLYCEKDANFPNHLPDPVKEENMMDLQKKVLAEKAEFGIGFDGDADRLGVIDEKGNLIYGDRLLGLLAKDALQRNKGAKVIFEVKCSMALEEWVRKNGGIPIMWKTGHSLIKAKIKEENAIIAGEMSGHMYFAENWFGFDDALLAAAKVVEIASNSNKKMSELINEMPSYFASPEYSIDFPDAEKFAFVKRAQDHFRKKYRVIDVDGARIIFENGWGLIRASNTQPKIIMRFEGKTKKDLEKVKSEILEEMESFSGKKIAL